MEPKFKAGQEVIVLAWWNAGRPVRCKLWSDSREDGVFVSPLTGNPHSRFVPAKDFDKVTVA